MPALDYAAVYEAEFRDRGLARRLRKVLAWTLWAVLFLVRPGLAREICAGR